MDIASNDLTLAQHHDADSRNLGTSSAQVNEIHASDFTGHFT